MKTISGLREALSSYFKDNSVKLTIVVQVNRSSSKAYTVGEVTLSMDVACSIFGNYEMLWNIMSTYEETNNVIGETDSYTTPCIRCGVYVPLIESNNQ